VLRLQADSAITINLGAIGSPSPPTYKFDRACVVASSRQDAASAEIQQEKGG